MKKSNFLIYYPLLALLGVGSPVFGAYTYTGGSYTQNFDSFTNPNGTIFALFATAENDPGELSLSEFSWVGNLSGIYDPPSSTGMGGWTFLNQTAGQKGTLKFDTGAGSASSLALFGSDATLSGIGDLALGSLSGAARNSAFGFVMQNNTGQTITEVSLSYTGEQWRLGRTDGNPDILSFGYAVGTANTIDTTLTAVPSLNFVTPQTVGTVGALDGNLAANQVAISDTLSVTLNPGDYLVLRWSDANESGADHGVAIDNFSLSTNVVPEPEAMAAAFGVAAIGIVLLRRRLRRNR